VNWGSSPYSRTKNKYKILIKNKNYKSFEQLIFTKKLTKNKYMRFGIRKPSFKKSFSAKFSLKRKVKNSLKLRVPKGLGIFINPKKAVYNKIYNKPSFSIFDILKKLFK
jgi:hypothetical protein